MTDRIDAAQKDLVDAHAPQDAAEVFETPNDAGQADQQPRLPHSNNSTATGHSPQASQEQSQGGGVLGMLGRALWGSRSTPPAQEGEHDTTDTAVSKEAPGYVPGDDTGRELLADTATSESPGKTGGLQGTNFEGDSSRDQDTSALGQPPTDYQTPKEHAAGHRDAQDSLGSATGSSAPQYESSSSSKALPSRSPLLEKPIDDHTVGIANEHPTGDVKPIEEQHGDVPHVPAASNVPLSNPEATSTAQELKHKAGSAFGKSPEEPHATDDAHSLHKPEPQLGADGQPGTHAAEADTGLADATGKGVDKSERLSPSGVNPADYGGYTSRPPAAASSHAVTGVPGHRAEAETTAAAAQPSSAAAAGTGSKAAAGEMTAAVPSRGTSEEPLPTSSNAGGAGHHEPHDSMPDLRPQSAFFKQSQEGALVEDAKPAPAQTAAGTPAAGSKADGKADGKAKQGGCCGCSVM